MKASPIKAQIIVTWYDLSQLGIEGLLKGDIVQILELDHHTSSEFGQCVLALDVQKQREWVIPLSYLKLLDI